MRFTHVFALALLILGAQVYGHQARVLQSSSSSMMTSTNSGGVTTVTGTVETSGGGQASAVGGNGNAVAGISGSGNSAGNVGVQTQNGSPILVDSNAAAVGGNVDIGVIATNGQQGVQLVNSVDAPNGEAAGSHLGTAVGSGQPVVSSSGVESSGANVQQGISVSGTAANTGSNANAGSSANAGASSTAAGSSSASGSGSATATSGASANAGGHSHTSSGAGSGMCTKLMGGIDINVEADRGCHCECMNQTKQFTHKDGYIVSKTVYGVNCTCQAPISNCSQAVEVTMNCPKSCSSDEVANGECNQECPGKSYHYIPHVSGLINSTYDTNVSNIIDLHNKPIKKDLNAEIQSYWNVNTSNIVKN